MTLLFLAFARIFILLVLEYIFIVFVSAPSLPFHQSSSFSTGFMWRFFNWLKLWLKTMPDPKSNTSFLKVSTAVRGPPVSPSFFAPLSSFSLGTNGLGCGDKWDKQKYFVRLEVLKSLWGDVRLANKTNALKGSITDHTHIGSPRSLSRPQTLLAPSQAQFSWRASLRA